MNIDLVYYFRQVNNFYYLNGPEKVNGNIVNNSPAYQLSSASDVMIKINQMISSLAPDITNVVLITSDLYTGDIQINTYSGEIKVGSEVPDYTDILTAINTNLTNLNSIKNSLKNIISCFSNVSSAQDNTAGSYIANNSFFRSIVYTFANTDQITSNTHLKTRSNFTLLNELLSSVLKQSVSPNASITDVISSLNSNIHNDLTELNTTTNNKDTVLIVDGQQDFVIRKQNNDDYDS